jgi:hypothetical protein
MDLKEIMWEDVKCTQLAQNMVRSRACVNTSFLLDTTGCFKKSFTTLKEYIHLFRGHVQCFEMS